MNDFNIGIVSGIISSFICNPLDVIRVHSQTDTKIKLNSPTIPITIGEELKTNIFLRCNESSIKDALNLNSASEQEIFSKLRDLKDSF